MCGIAGVYSTSAVAREALDALAGALAHRGPDGSGMHLDGCVGLVHTRLAIIDLDQGAQPLYSDDGMLCVVANGEIYNHVELRAELQAKGYRFATSSDCEPLLYAYREWGEAFLERVDGMFALALHDRARRRLLLARDRLGIKPLFLAAGDDGLCFASELKALFRLIGKPAVGVPGLLQYLQNGFASGADTLCSGIRRVLPGEAVRLGDGGIERRWRYWSPLAVRQRGLAPDEAAEAFQALMATVARQHLRADVPSGIFLSGGVDSAVLLGLLQEASDRSLPAYTVSFPGASVESDVEAAARAARCYGARHHVLHATADDLWTHLPFATWAADELMSDPASLAVSLLAARAAREVKVIFSGEGGDEVFGGYGRYRRGWLQRLLAGLLAPGSGGFRARPTFPRARIRALLGEELRAVAREWRRPFVEAWRETPPPWTDLQRMQYADIVTWLPDDLLVKADRMTMAHGLEARVPYLDHRVVELGLALPDRLKVSGRTGKVFLRQFGKRLLPEGLLHGPKRGFTVPLSDLLRRPCAARLGEALAATPGIRRWFKPEAVIGLVAETRSSGRSALLAWRLLQFALWHRLFVELDGRAPAPSVDPLDLLTHGPRHRAFPTSASL